MSHRDLSQCPFFCDNPKCKEEAKRIAKQDQIEKEEQKERPEWSWLNE